MCPPIVLRRENVPRGPEAVRWSKLIEQTLMVATNGGAEGGGGGGGGYHINM